MFQKMGKIRKDIDPLIYSSRFRDYYLPENTLNCYKRFGTYTCMEKLKQESDFRQ